MKKILVKYYEKARLKVRNWYVRKTASWWQKKINKTDFTIISNNCWGGTVYQSYGLPYQSPTVGLFIMPEDYVKFVKDLPRYLKKKLIFIDQAVSKWHKVLNRDLDYPVAKLGDIEIYFMHYRTPKEAKEKWQRRVKRVNYDRIIYKMSDQNCCARQDLLDFMALPLKNKLCFASRDYGIPGTVVIKDRLEVDQNVGGLLASHEPYGRGVGKMNINEFINDMEAS